MRFLKRGIGSGLDAAQRGAVCRTVEATITDLGRSGDAAVRERARKHGGREPANSGRCAHQIEALTVCVSAADGGRPLA